VERNCLGAVTRWLLASLVLAASFAAAAPALAEDPRAEKEALALQKRAIQEDNLYVDYPGAIAKLRKAIRRCSGGRCGWSLRAALLRDLGAMQVLGGDSEAARTSFAQALAIEASLELDAAYRNPQVAQVWMEVKRRRAGAPSSNEPLSEASAGPSEAKEQTEAMSSSARSTEGGQRTETAAAPVSGATTFTHVPAREGLVRTPLPVYAEYAGKDPIARVTVQYKGAGMAEWKRLDLRKIDSGWGGSIPCNDVELGTMLYYLQGFDSTNDAVTALGSRTKPFTVPIQQKIAEGPSNLPGQAPPAQCPSDDCPSDVPGCSAQNPAEKGECSYDDDCATGACREGKCVASQGGGAVSPRLWVGIAASLDFFFMPGTKAVCRLDPATRGTTTLTPGNPYACLDPNTNAFFPGRSARTDASIDARADSVDNGLTHGNLRLLVSIDYALTSNVLVGLRGGYTLFTDPARGMPGPVFPPLHAEARYAFVFGKNAMSQAMTPLVFFGGGVGEFDAFVAVPVFLAGSATPVYKNAWLTAGPGFVTAGGGLRLLVARTVAATANLKLEAAFAGQAGLLVGAAPELGVQLGF
jgi:hypothetical protein